jgi:hypothetical protein
MSWETDLLQGVAQRLNDFGVGVYANTYAATDTAIVFGDLPTSPDRCIGLGLYAATDAVRQNLTTVRMQLMMRGAPNNSLDVLALADAVFDVLHGLVHVDFGSAHAVQVLRVSAVPLGTDGNKRVMRADNYEIPVNVPQTVNRPG